MTTIVWTTAIFFFATNVGESEKEKDCVLFVNTPQTKEEEDNIRKSVCEGSRMVPMNGHQK